MSSLITDFDYDIFISYRHNDNRFSWETEFVMPSQEELAVANSSYEEVKPSASTYLKESFS